MSQPTVRLLVLQHKGKTFVYRESDLAVAKEALSEEEYAHLEAAGEWREMWLRPALARHEQEIQARCQIRDAAAGFRYDSSKEPAARCAVLVEKWTGFPKAPSEEAFDDLPLVLAKVIDNAILDHMYPSVLDPDFFEGLRTN